MEGVLSMYRYIHVLHNIDTANHRKQRLNCTIGIPPYADAKTSPFTSYANGLLAVAPPKYGDSFLPRHTPYMLDFA